MSDEKRDGKDPSKPKRFLNGWTKEQEHLMSEWSDIAMCYRWIHDQSEKRFHKKTMYINLPVIILSTLGGTANFGIQSLFEDDTIKKYASFGIGGISLLAGLLTTIGNYLRYPQMEEAHRVSSVSWGKLQRLIAIELALHPNDRSDSLDFLKICRAELDRLIEQSPPIPQEVIYKFEERFGSISGLKKPDVCGALEHTMVFESSEERLKQLSVETAMAIKRRKDAVAELIAPEVQKNLRDHVALEIENAMELKRAEILQSMEEEKKAEEDKVNEINKMMEERRKKIQLEIEQWGGRGQRSQSATTLEARLNHNANHDASHLQKAVIKRTPPASPPLKASVATPSAPPENIVMNPLFDRASIIASQRSPRRPPHPVYRSSTPTSTQPKGKN